MKRAIHRLLPPGYLVLGILAICTLWSTVAVAAGPVSSSGESSEVGASSHLTWMIVYATVALVFSFLCSVAEAVMLSMSPSYIEHLRNTGKQQTAERLGRLKSNIDRSLAAILTLNTIAHTVGAGGAGAEAAAYFGDKYVGISMAVLTLLILFLSEIVPKTLGALHWRGLAPITSQFVQWLIWILYPFILVSELLTKLLARGKDPHAFKREEFAAMVNIGAEAGQLDDTESRILNNLFRFPELCAEDIMTPRTVVFALQQDKTVSEVMSDEKAMHFSRIPIYADNRDEVTGFVLKADILLNQLTNEGKCRLRDLKREIGGVHERTHLGKVLEELLDNRSHILLVVDSYGGMEGIVTLEDVVETLIGIEIVDEADTIDDMRRLARQKWEERMKIAGIDVREPTQDQGEDERAS
jgi:CBS domain containing-hemolysin-like protein